MTRAVWKLPLFRPFNLPKLDPQSAAPVQIKAPTKKIHPKDTRNLQKQKQQEPQEAPSNLALKTEARNCTILPSFVGHTFYVHNGKKYMPIKITEEMIGHRLGEFSFTKKVALHLAKLEKAAAKK